ncbi:MAG: hypothetical protein COA91_00515 [Robiginitomaculum sp.]|nr:MAG: hypothetical protein COA91_00515 [Robiginitomaculum sp.]
MFKIDKDKNEISALTKCSFSSLGFEERQHLQEWIAKKPECLGEELLIIQKEFSGFSDTNERLDLLALDKHGALVIIENKLDDTGKDVTWQALKYTSYCSSLTTSQIVKIFQEYLRNEQSAEDTISAFLEEDFDSITLNKGFSQRIFLIAANFRKEVTSTVLWLSNFKIQVKCFKVTPYSMGDDNLFLSVEQIIPTKDAEEYTIGLADKAQDEVASLTSTNATNALRHEFWAKVFEAARSKTRLFQNRSTTKDTWIEAPSGTTNISYFFSAIKSCCRAELYIQTKNREHNERIYDHLYNIKFEIEKSFGGELIWERETVKGTGCRVKAESKGNIYDKAQWPEMITFLVDAMIRMEAAFKEPLKQLKNKI